jgi:hypothetical protein
MMDLNAGRRRKPRFWLLIILIAVAVHLIILFGVKTQYFNVFRKSIDDNIASSSRQASFPDAIVAITVDVEGDETAPVEIVEPPVEQRETNTEQVDSPNEQDSNSEDVLDILGDLQTPLPSRPSTQAAVIPPRPIEITWPETKNLSHCLGMHVDVRIHVGINGEILGIDPVDSRIPDDCAAAAVSAAKRIVFLPGTVDGHAKAMWTDIRIDFRRQSD